MNLLYAHVVLDRSGSMGSCRTATIDAFNEYVNGLAVDANTDAAVSLTLFDEIGNKPSIDLIHDGVKAKDMPKLTTETYEPRGSTPLNDAIGATVARMRKEWHRPGEKIVLVVLSDGQENCSKEYTTSAIKALLEQVQKDGWLVIYLGANQDSFAEGVKQRGTNMGNTMNFDPKHMGATLRAASRSTVSYAATGDFDAAAFTDSERHGAAAGDSDDALAKLKHHADATKAASRLTRAN